MRAVVLAIVVVLAGCSRTPEQQQTDDLRSDARDQGAALENQAVAEANRMEQRAIALSERAKRARGDLRENINFEAETLAKEAKKVRRQADQQADAIKEATDARIKRLQSR